MKPKCSIDQCENPSEKRGWCRAHYLRWYRHGDPEAGRVANGEAKKFLQKALAYTGDECLAWPHSRRSDGRGQISWGGVPRLVSRVVCELAHGAPPTPAHEAAHSCGKGHEGCITPGHLSWKSSADNHADMVAHGTRDFGERNHAAKLRLIDVQDIREKHGKGMLQKHIAAIYGVSPSTVNDIICGRTWTHT